MTSIARIGIQTDTADAEKGVKNVRQMFGNLGKDIKGGLMAGLGLGAGLSAFNAVQGAVSGLVDGIRDSVDAASNLAESQSKVNTVFGESSAEINEWAKNSANAFGSSRQAALEAAGTYGNLLQAFGIAGPQAADMSKQLVQLASDLASFNNTSVEEAIQALRSGLSGETEPLKRYGIAISDARMRTELMAQGITDLGATLTPQQKSLAAYALIMKDSSLAQGDFARTSDGLANQQRILKANLENVSAQVGEKLLPIVLKLAQFANDTLVPALGAVVSYLDTASRNIGNFADGVSDTVTFFQIRVGDLGKTVEDRANAIGVDVAQMKEHVLTAMTEMGMGIGDATKYAEERMLGIPLAATTASRDMISAWKQADLGGQTKDAVEPMGDAIVDTVTEAKEEATEEARKIPGSLADAILSGKDDLEPVKQAIKDILAGSVSDAASLAEDAATLVNPGIKQGLTSNSLETRQAMLHDVVEPLVTSMNTLNPKALLTGEGVPKELRQGIFNQRDVAIAEVTALRDSMAPEMDLAEFAEKHGLEGVASLIRGMQAKEEEAKRVAGIVASRAANAMDINAYSGGASIVSSWINGMTGAWGAQQYRVRGMAGAAARIFGQSLPTDGPLKGGVSSGGESIGESWIEGITKSIGAGMGRVTGLVGQVGGVLGGGGSSGPAGAGRGGGVAPGGSPVVLQFQLDGRTIAEVVDPWLYRLQPAGASVLPRGS